MDEAGELTARAYLDDGLLDLGASDPYLSTLYLSALRDARRRAAHADLLVAVEEGGSGLLGTVTFVGRGGEYAEIAAEGEAEFQMLAVRPAARGRGVGEALVRESCGGRAAPATSTANVHSTGGPAATAPGGSAGTPRGAALSGPAAQPYCRAGRRRSR